MDHEPEPRPPRASSFAPLVLGAASDAALARALFEASPFSTVLYDPAGRILHANAAFEQLFGVTLANLPRDYSVLSDPQLEAAGYLPDVRRAFAGESVVLPLVKYDPVALIGMGRMSWTQGHFYPLRDERGAVRMVVLVHVDLTARVRAESATRLLADAGLVLAHSLDYEATLASLTRLVVPSLADWCAIDVPDGQGGLRRVATAHVDPAKVAVAEEMGRRYPPEPGAVLGPARVLRTGQAERHGEVSDALRRQLARDDQHLAMLRELAVHAALILPLHGREGVLGVLSLGQSQPGRGFDEGDIALAEELARRAATAMEHALLHRGVVESHDALDEARRHAEESRAVSLAAEREVRGILESFSDPMVVLDAEWHYRHINGAAATIFGRGGRQLHGVTLWEAYPPLLGTRFEAELRRAMQQRVAVSFEEHYPGTGLWSEVRCYPLASGGIVVSWKDVTERKRAEDSRTFLADASKLLAASLDVDETVGSLARLLVPRLGDWCSVNVLEADGRIRQAAVAHVDPERVRLAREMNARYPAAADAATGVPRVIRTGRPELIADVTDEILAAATRDAEHLRLARELGLHSAMIVPLAAQDRVLGAISLVSADAGRRYDEADLALATEVARRAGVALDNARLHREALDARAAAEAANAAKAQFLATMSHELRTPLNAIAGYTELLAMGIRGPVTDQQIEDLGRIRQSQRHLLSLINDILNYAKLEAGRVQFEVKAVPVASALAALEPLVAPQLAARGIRYEPAAPEASLAVLADSEKLRQVLLNLLSNAVKFTAPGGHVLVGATADQRRVRIAVRDTGIGIAADKLETIFEPFVQLSRGFTATHEGTGLGLAISRDLARGMGGDIEVESEPGAGSTFTLVLPRAAGDPRSAG